MTREARTGHESWFTPEIHMYIVLMCACNVSISEISGYVEAFAQAPLPFNIRERISAVLDTEKEEIEAIRSVLCNNPRAVSALWKDVGVLVPEKWDRALAEGGTFSEMPLIAGEISLGEPEECCLSDAYPPEGEEETLPPVGDTVEVDSIKVGPRGSSVNFSEGSDVPVETLLLLLKAMLGDVRG